MPLLCGLGENDPPQIIQSNPRLDPRLSISGGRFCAGRAAREQIARDATSPNSASLLTLDLKNGGVAGQKGER